MENKIKVGIKIENKKYGEAVAKGLGRLSGSLELHLLESELQSLDEEVYHGIITDEILEETPNINDLFLWLQSEFYQKTGQHFKERKGEETKIIQCVSDEGGSGVTVVALTLGKLLASKYNKKTLYITDDIRFEKQYFIEDFRDIKSNLQLEYELKKKRSIFLPEYLKEDEYGLFTIQTGSPLLVTETVLKETDFERIIIDLKENLEIEMINSRLIVRNNLDSRSHREIKKKEKDICILNRCSGLSEEPSFCIKESKESFSKSQDGRVLIFMDKEFGADVRRIVGVIENE